MNKNEFDTSSEDSEEDEDDIKLVSNESIIIHFKPHKNGKRITKTRIFIYSSVIVGLLVLGHDVISYCENNQFEEIVSDMSEAIRRWNTTVHLETLNNSEKFTTKKGSAIFHRKKNK